jgi:hypothetical protein
MRTILLCLLGLCPSVATAQIVMPDNIDPYRKIVAGCDCIVPKDGLVQIRWRVDPQSESAIKPAVGEERVDKLHIWAPPGNHWVQALVIVTTMQEIRAEVTDTQGNKSIQTIKVPSGFQFFDYDKNFTVGKPGPGPAPGPDPPPGPDPDPGPGPTPTDPFALEIYKMFIRVNEANLFSKPKFEKLADAFEAVASEAVATPAVFNATAFTNRTKDEYKKIFTLDEITKLGPIFSQPLAQYQLKVFQERGGSANDEKALALLWQDTATAMRTAVSDYTTHYSIR